MSRAVLVVLALLAFVLPLVEAPKNLLWLLFVSLCAVAAVRAGLAGQPAFGRPEHRHDLVFAGLFLAPLISVVCAPVLQQWTELGNIVVYLSVGWVLSRVRLNERQTIALLSAAVAGTLVALALGVWIKVRTGHQYLELHSVGQVNHSALYGAAIGSLVLVATAACWPRLRRSGRIAMALLSAAFFVLMFIWGSRGALLAYLAGLAMFGLYFLRAMKYRLVPALAGAAVLAALTLTATPLLIEKTASNFVEGSRGSLRLAAASTAFEIWRHAPLTGVGAAAFASVSPEQVRGWVTARGETYVEDNYLFSNHAHSLFFNTLAERGLVGVAALLALLVVWSMALWQRRPDAGSSALHWLIWGSGLAGWSMVFVGGLFNTTLHHEHGMLGMLLFGLLLGSLPGSLPVAEPA